MGVRDVQRWPVAAAWNLVVAGAYLGTAKLGLALAFATPNVTAVWPPTGIAIAAVVLGGPRLLFGVAAGAFLANVTTDVPLATVLGITAGNTLEAAVAAGLLRLARFRPSFERVLDVLLLGVLAGAIATTFSATVGVLSLHAGGELGADFWSVWRVWWLGDMGGALIVTPFILVVATRWPYRLARQRLGEAAAVALTLVGLGAAVFLYSEPPLYPFLLFPIVMWAAFRFLHVGAVAASVLVASLSALFTQAGIGPFAGMGLDASLLAAQTFAGVTAVTALVLAVVTCQRHEVEASAVESASVSAHMAAIVESTSDAVMSTDRGGAVTAWNPGAEGTYGYPASEMVGAGLERLFPTDRQDDLARLNAAVRSGREIASMETEHLRADGARLVVSLSASPIIDPVAGVTGAAVVARDVTAATRSQRAQEFLAAAGGALDASLDPDETLRTITRTAVPELAELCVIDLFRPDGTLGDTYAASVDPAIAHELEEIRRRWPIPVDGEHPVAEVFRSRRPMVIRNLEEPQMARRVAQSGVHGEFTRRAGYRSAAVAPMMARGRTLGVLALLHVRSDLRYDAADLQLVEDLASRAAMALDNARLYAERTRTAAILERSLLPQSLPEVPGLDVAMRYEATGEEIQVGGDFYDLFQADAGWLLVVGDVAGKGSAAAAITSLVRHGLRTLAMGDSRPSRLLAGVNEVMLRHGTDNRFATAIVVRFEPDAGGMGLTLACAGHPPALLLTPDGGVAAIGRGPLLGVYPGAHFRDERRVLARGETLVLYTDGVLDAGAPDAGLEPRDLERLVASMRGRSAAEVVARLTGDALARGGNSLRDDLVVLAARFTGD